MHCPNCKELMVNRDERHHVNPDSYRMNLHCWNREGLIACRPCHMGVIVVPNGQEWICDHYNFVFNHKALGQIILRATPSTPVLKQKNGRFYLWYGSGKYTELLKSYGEPPMIQIPFVPLSTGDDMHLEAERLCNRLANLIVYS